MLHVGASYATERERAGWSGEFSLRSRAFEVGIGAERAAVTNNEWIRSDFENSLFFAFSGRDYRDYYEADRYVAHIGYQWTRRSVDFSAGMRFQVEDARSLPTFGDAWSLVDDEPDRPNPSIDHGRITSLQGSLGVSWDGNTIEGSASLGLEGAARVAGGDFAFGRFEIDAVAALAALANHSLLVEWRARGPIPGTDSLPQQRWSALGGRGTLYTHDILSLRGDRMVYLETEYLIPIPVLESAPIIGRPAIGLVHHAGMSWSSSQPREFEQNLGLRLRLRLLWVLGMIDPEDTDRNGLFIGIGLPLRYPWWPDTL